MGYCRGNTEEGQPVQPRVQEAAFKVFIFLRASGIDMPGDTKYLFFWKSVVQGLSEHWDRASDLPFMHIYDSKLNY